MESLPKGIYLKYNENTLKSVRKLFGFDKPGAMEDAINILEDWVKMQKHFTKIDFDRKYLETAIIVSKGSVERAKCRIDRACTFRTLMPHVFRTHDIRHLVTNHMKGIECAVLPKLTKNNIRVTIFRVTDQYFDVLSISQASTYVTEYLRRYDYPETNCLVIDYEKTNVMEIVMKLTSNITTVQQMIIYTLACCGFRLRNVYIINSSSKFIEGFLATYKQITSVKMRERLQVLKDRKSLSEIFDKEILPIEYGGTEKPLVELVDNFLDELTSEEHTQYMKEMNSARTDETRRQSMKFNEEYLGVPGSFRQLYVD